MNQQADMGVRRTRIIIETEEIVLIRRGDIPVRRWPEEPEETPLSVCPVQETGEKADMGTPLFSRPEDPKNKKDKKP